jgi:hypothetical protein
VRQCTSIHMSATERKGIFEVGSQTQARQGVGATVASLSRGPAGRVGGDPQRATSDAPRTCELSTPSRHSVRVPPSLRPTLLELPIRFLPLFLLSQALMAQGQARSRARGMAAAACHGVQQFWENVRALRRDVADAVRCGRRSSAFESSVLVHRVICVESEPHRAARTHDGAAFGRERRQR